jgi:PAS domain S-box-containing protein
MEPATSGTPHATGRRIGGTRGGEGEGEGAEVARQRRALRVGGALFLCVFVGAVAVAWNDLRVRRDAGERYVQALVDSHARQLHQELDNIERAFRGVAEATAAIRQIAPEATPAVARETLAAIAARNRRLNGLRAAAVAPPFLPLDAAPLRLYLGTPLQGKDHRWSIPVAMRLQPGAEGPLWLRAEFDVDSFSDVLQAHEVGPDGVASVLTTDGVLVARSDSGTRHAGLDARFSPVFQALASSETGVVESTNRLDGVRRIVGYRAVGEHPLVATVGMTPQALHGGWWTFVATLALGMALLLAALLAGLWLLRRAARRELDMRQGIAAREHTLGHLRERVRDAEEQYRFLFHQHPLPAAVYDRETLRILEVNAAAVHQYGYPREAMLGGMQVAALLEGGAADDIRGEFNTYPHAYGRKVWVQRRRDGTTFSALVFACNLETFAGRPARLAQVLDVTERLRAE